MPGKGGVGKITVTTQIFNKGKKVRWNVCAQSLINSYTVLVREAGEGLGLHCNWGEALLDIFLCFGLVLFSCFMLGREICYQNIYSICHIMCELVLGKTFCVGFKMFCLFPSTLCHSLFGRYKTQVTGHRLQGTGHRLQKFNNKVTLH